MRCEREGTPLPLREKGGGERLEEQRRRARYPTRALACARGPPPPDPLPQTVEPTFELRLRECAFPSVMRCLDIPRILCIFVKSSSLSPDTGVVALLKLSAFATLPALGTARRRSSGLQGAVPVGVTRRRTMTSSHEEFQELSKSHARHQIALTVLSVALVAATLMMWMLVNAVRESNEIQKELLASSQQVDVAPKTPVNPRSVAPAPRKASTGSRRSPSASGGRQRSSPERALAQSAPPTQVASTHTLASRHGRQ